MPQEIKKPCALALGFFDGVHLGHGALLRQTAERARTLGCVPAALSFDVHPDTLVRGEPVLLINGAEDRAKLLRELYGMERVELFPFTPETMRLPWDEFLTRIRRELNVVAFVAGYDFRFGWQGEGNARKLRLWCREQGLSCDIIGQVRLGDVTVSSTHIRTLLAQGDMPGAARFLGHPHILTDTVRHGQQLGRKLGAPTVNMQFAPGVLVPPKGVYATVFRLPEGVFPAVTNVGERPTVDESGRITVESHLLGFSGDLYGRMLTVEFYDFLRPERRFDSPEALAARIARDGELARERLKEQL